MDLWNVFLWTLMILIAFTMGLGAVKETTRSAASPPSSPVSTLGARLFPTAEASPTPAAIPTVEELEEPEVPEEKPPPKEPEQEMATIQCPGCSAKMTVPKLAKLQTVTCENCGLSGELEI